MLWGNSLLSVCRRYLTIILSPACAVGARQVVVYAKNPGPVSLDLLLDCIAMVLVTVMVNFVGTRKRVRRA